MKTPKLYQLICLHCNYKRFTDGSDIDDLVRYKQSPIPRGSPVFDPITKKTILPKSIKRNLSFKCPNCGFLIKASLVPNTLENKNHE